ncbi:D-aminopeptidase [Pandoraea terrae]|uniref:D-aminopeptidase n=1 Tax=Pandoraea terrae TaxID=1537710 RepID=A0A5E4RXD1_9BURK|nr:M55 family metallopeptidase [Pandoraea terrae]VVD67094.1 D-aminopeptidase [Pandoraea terrae]
MRILISADIEGVAGVFHAEQTRAGNGEYERARRWMTLEANAAVQGAFAGGATEVIVNDSHGGFRNLLPDELDSRVKLVLGKPRYLGMMAGLECGCDAVFLIGYHGRSQSRSVLAHTINSFAFARVWLAGEEVGEAGLYGALAGERGVPVVLGSGDDVFCEETQSLFPHARFVEVKRAHGQGTGMTLSPQAAREAISAAAREVLAAPGNWQPRRVAVPVDVRLQAQTTALADLFCQWPSLERVDGVTLKFTAQTVEAAVRILNSLSAMSFMLR